MGNSTNSSRKSTEREGPPSVKTGDALIFAGARGLSKLVMCGTNSSFSHTGLAVCIDGEVYVSQSTPNPGKLTGLGETKPGRGVMITRLKDELKSGFYSGAAHRPLLKPLSVSQQNDLLKFAKSKIGVISYDGSTRRLVNAGFDCQCCGTRDLFRNTDASPADAFCSEWAAIQLRHVGVLKQADDPRGDMLKGDLPPPPPLLKVQKTRTSEIAAEFTPGDFAGQGAGADSDRLNHIFGSLRDLKLPEKTRVGACSAFWDCAH